MATIQIRDIPEDTYEVIRKRARAAGKSIQSYMRDEVISMASRQTKAEVLAAVEATLAKRTAPGPTRDMIVAEIRELRGA